MTISTRSLAMRLFAKVDQRGDDECWPWLGCLDKHGYGAVNVRGRPRSAYRVAYELLVGEVPPGLELDHTCHTRDTACPGGGTCPHRRCVNPAHLQPVTRRENVLRGRSIPAVCASRDQCSRGHDYTQENTRIERSNGSRSCRKCERDRERIRLLPTRVGPKPPVTQCRHGHPFDAENTYQLPSGRRQCRACKNQRKRDTRAAHRAAQEAMPV